MTGFEDKVLGGIAALLLVLIVGAVFGRLHGSAGTEVRHIGDRVACGLLALPLISLAVHLAFPCANNFWVLSAPFPLAIYVLLLAGTDPDPDVDKDKNTDKDKNEVKNKLIRWAKSTKKFIEKHFTATLVVFVMLVYLIMVAYALRSR